MAVRTLPEGAEARTSESTGRWSAWGGIEVSWGRESVSDQIWVEGWPKVEVSVLGKIRMPVPEVWIRWPGVGLRARPVSRAVAAEQESASARSEGVCDISEKKRVLDVVGAAR